MNLKIRRDQPDLLTIELEGHISRDSVPELRKSLLKVARHIKASTMKLDFSAVYSLDTSGVAMLVELQTVLFRSGGRLILTALSDETRRVIRLARLDQSFETNGNTLT